MKVAAVIPAYNEEKYIGAVLSVVCHTPSISEVIVVCDGCTDSTASVAAQAGVNILVLPENQGKGAAMLIGAGSTDADIIMFLDADLIGLTQIHLLDLIRPVLSGTADMSVGIFSHGRITTDMAQFIAPYLSGQRAIHKSLLKEVTNMEVARYGIEVTMTKYARKLGWRVKEVVLPELTHIMKEEKLGLIKGIGARAKMYWEIAKCLTPW